MPMMQSRRRFLSNVGLAGAAAVGAIGGAGFGGARKSLAAEPPPEVTTVRLEKDPVLCIAPQVVEEFLSTEGFSDIRYVQVTEAHMKRAEAINMGPIPDMIARGEIDFGRDFAPTHLLAIDSGAPITLLAGMHRGCFEVFAQENIHRVADLKGKTVAYGMGDKPLLAIMAHLIGLEPADINWVPSYAFEMIELFVGGKIDAFLAVPPALQEVRARNHGHVLVSQISDHPWSEYYCCMLGANATFVNRYPIATKRVLRAMLKGADLCVSDPKRIADLMVERGYTTRSDYALQMLSEVRFDAWRDYDPDDTLRFYALRLQEVGLIKAIPQKVIVRGTDWRFLNELKQELKT